MAENFSPVTPETTSPDNEVDTDKTKKKKKALGAFIVEAEPGGKRQKFWEKDKPEASPLEKLKSDWLGEKTDKKTSSEPSMEPEASAEEADSDVEKLDTEETAIVVSQLAADRLEEIQAETGEEVSPEEQAAVEAYLASVEATGEFTDAETPDDDGEAEPADTRTPGEGTAEEQVDEPDPVSSPPSPPTPPAPPTPPTGGNTGGNGQPPVPPSPTPQPAGNPGRPGSGGGFGGPGGPLPNLLATAALARERQAKSEGLVTGAVIGYLIGRRRGRIKTEKRLIPVQKKLEKQVVELKSRLISHENQVRQQVREKTNPISKQPEARRPVVAERRTTPFAVPPERIGQVLVKASANGETAPVKKPIKAETAAIRKQVESMDRQQLIEISQKIQVEGTTLKQIYETQLISEKGLRRLVAEHLRGGNVSRALKRELVERQIDFERDPILRDQSHGTGSEGAGKAALAAMLSRAGMPAKAEPETVGFGKTKSGKPDAAKAPKRTGQQATADIALVTVIVTLVLVIGAVLMRG